MLSGYYATEHTCDQIHTWSKRPPVRLSKCYVHCAGIEQRIVDDATDQYDTDCKDARDGHLEPMNACCTTLLNAFCC